MAIVFSFHANEGQTIRAELKRQAEVLLVDEENFEKRLRGLDYRALGSHFATTPALIHVPRSGRWRLVIEDHEGDEATATLLAA